MENLMMCLDVYLRKDECGDSDAQKELTDFIAGKLSGLPPILRLFITSRPEKGVSSLSQSTTPHLCVHGCIDPKLDDSKRDVVLFIKHEMGWLKEKGEIVVEENWPWDENMERLGDAADGVFIWASTVIKYITAKKLDRFEFLVNLIENSKILIKDLSGLYATVMKDSLDWNDDITKERFSNVFSLILFGGTSMTNEDIDDILGLKSGKTKELLSCLQSLVMYGGDGRICVQHTSLYDYLVGCEGEKWHIDSNKEKIKIACRCLGLMKDQLRFNICDLETSFKFNKDVHDLQERVNKQIHLGLLYACRHWASHLQDVPYSDGLLFELDHFVYKQLLYWIEVLSLTGYLYQCFEPVLESVIGWVKELVQVPNLILEQNKETHTPSELLSFLEDALHHVFEFIQPISESAPHLYMTFLPFKKSESDVARHYSSNMKEPTCIEYIGDKPTLGCTSHFNVGSSVYSLSLWDDYVISGSPSGACLWDFNGRKFIRSSKGDTSVWYYSDDRNVIIYGGHVLDEWGAFDCKSERMYGLPAADIGHVTSVSGDRRKYYATGFEDGTIQLWDRREKTAIGELLRGHLGKVLALVFGESGDKYLASGSEDQSIIIWNVERREKKYSPLRSHSGSITSLVSTTGKLVSGSLDGTVRLWDVSTGEMLRAFSPSEMDGVYSVANYDNRHILSGSEDGIIRLWDIEHWEIPPKKFVGHKGTVISLSVDNSIKGIRFASGCSDGTIQIWDVEREREIVRGTVYAMAVSPNGEYLVSGTGHGIVSVWRIETGEQVKGLLHVVGCVTSVSFSPDGFHFASGSYGGIVRIWNLDGESVTCSTEWQELQNICFSPDGKHVASGFDNIIQAQEWREVRTLCFSPDGKHVASGSGNTIRVWDSKTGELALNPFEGHSEFIKSICYSPDGNKIVSVSDDKTIHIWDASNGALLLTLRGHSEITSVTYSHDGSYILSGSKDGTIRVWNANGDKPLREPINVQESPIVQLYFSRDDTYFISVSRDKTICVLNTSTGELLFKENIPLSLSLSLLLSFFLRLTVDTSNLHQHSLKIFISISTVWISTRKEGSAMIRTMMDG